MIGCIEIVCLDREIQEEKSRMCGFQEETGGSQKVVTMKTENGRKRKDRRDRSIDILNI